MQPLRVRYRKFVLQVPGEVVLYLLAKFALLLALLK